MDEATVGVITGSVDFATIVVGIGGVFAAVALISVALKGGRMLISAIGGK